jgi:hypothetical protein
MSFDVHPSIRVREFQPVTASCAGPIRRALGSVPYRLSVEALGFTPRSFTYTLTAPALRDVEPISIRHVTSSAVDTVGNELELVMPDVPENRLSYGIAVSIAAVDDAGRTHQNVFSLTVSRPIEAYYNGNVTLAELFAPVPVTGCIPGGEIGRSVNYTETTSETRDRRLDYNWNSNWLDSHTVSEGSTDSIGVNERNGVGFSTTDGETIHWNVGGSVTGTYGTGAFTGAVFRGSVAVTASGGYGEDYSTSQTQNQDYSAGVDRSTTTTESVTDMVSTGGGEGGSLAMSVSSSESVALWFNGNIIARMQGVFYRQTARLVRRAAMVTYNQCGAPEVVGQVELEDWTWSPDLAVGRDCPPYPQSNLAPAECFLSPCVGE